MSIDFTCPECAEQNSVGPEFGGRRGKCAFCGATVIVPQTSGVAQAVPGSVQAAPPKSGGSWIWILAIVGGVLGVMVVCGGILVALLLPAVQAAREAARKAQCSNNLRQISIALQSYAATYGHFPPAATVDKNGRPLMSWRVAILPFMEQNALYRQYDPNQPWNSAKNSIFAKTLLPEFRCPSDPDAVGGDTS